MELFEYAPDDPNVLWLEDWLRRAGCWSTAAQLHTASGDRLSDRYLRALASASEWIISGQLGYKHLEHATVEEIDHAANWMESQASKMTERATRWRNNVHRRIG